MLTKQFSVYGRVQGVGFRFFTCQQAQRLGITGFVRNRRDGSVEVVAQGEEAILAQLETWLHQGSPAARVERVLVQAYPDDVCFHGFDIQR